MVGSAWSGVDGRKNQKVIKGRESESENELMLRSSRVLALTLG